MSETLSGPTKKWFSLSVLIGWTCTLCVLCVQMFFVVPRFSMLYADAQRTVPILTSYVIQLSNVAIGNPFAMLSFLLLISFICGVCAYLVRRMESNILCIIYTSTIFLLGGIANIAFFAAVYFPIFSQ